MDSQLKVRQIKPLLCSDCFRNNGLRLDAMRLGQITPEPCPNCGSANGARLGRRTIETLAHRFFVVGSLHKTEYGGAPIIEFNSYRSNEITQERFHSEDADLISSAIGIGFFYYGPPLWRIGCVQPLEALQNIDTRDQIIARILTEYPEYELKPELTFYRVRKFDSGSAGNKKSDQFAEYDSPPDGRCGEGRLDSAVLPILYGSPDLEICIHECRITAEDLTYVASLSAARPLRMLDLTAVLKEDVTSFDSLDMAVHMIFLAAAHSYPLTRAIAAAAHAAGFEGILFPSYFSLLRTGAPFIQTVYGLSTRKFQGAAEREGAKIIPNVAVFGRPIADGRVMVSCINRLYIRQVAYDIGFGPATT